MRAANKRAEPDEREQEPDERQHKKVAKRARKVAKKRAAEMPVVEAVDGPQQKRVVSAPLVEPAPRGGIIEALQQRYVRHLMVRRMLAAMYANSVLGLMWSYVQPALRFAVYYVIMGYVFHLHQGTPYFAMHLFTGIVFVHLFSEAWSQGTRSIWSNRSLIQKLRIPREIFPIAAIEVAALHTMPQAVLLVFFCLISGWHLTVSAVAAGILGFAIIATFATAMGLLFSALNVYFRDFQNIVQTLLQFMHFMVPMMYPFSRIWALGQTHPLFYQLYMANPVANGVLLLQQLFWYSLIEHKRGIGVVVPPDLWTRGIIVLAACVVILMFAQRSFSRLEGKFPERL
ncbi:MAG TPA: ABC transporter permease [Marmoricola sp.]|nr:ABC transporter permease [Marmoricola sp.]